MISIDTAKINYEKIELERILKKIIPVKKCGISVYWKFFFQTKKHETKQSNRELNII
jgi:hypothetical protein